MKSRFQRALLCFWVIALLRVASFATLTTAIPAPSPRAANSPAGLLLPRFNNPYNNLSQVIAKFMPTPYGQALLSAGDPFWIAVYNHLSDSKFLGEMFSPIYGNRNLPRFETIVPFEVAHLYRDMDIDEAARVLEYVDKGRQQWVVQVNEAVRAGLLRDPKSSADWKKFIDELRPYAAYSPLATEAFIRAQTARTYLKAIEEATRIQESIDRVRYEDRRILEPGPDDMGYVQPCPHSAPVVTDVTQVEVHPTIAAMIRNAVFHADPLAQYSIGNALARGTSVPKNIELAKLWLAQYGDTVLVHQALGDIYVQSWVEDRKVEDLEAAFREYSIVYLNTPGGPRQVLARSHLDSIRKDLGDDKANAIDKQIERDYRRKELPAPIHEFQKISTQLKSTMDQIVANRKAKPYGMGMLIYVGLFAVCIICLSSLIGPALALAAIAFSVVMALTNYFYVRRLDRKSVNEIYRRMIIPK